MTCPRGKKGHATYAEALAALVQLERDQLGHVYTCPSCQQFHVTKGTTLTRQKSRGRGKRRGEVA